MHRPSSLSHLSSFVKSRLSSKTTEKAGSGAQLPDQQPASQQQQSNTYQNDNEDEEAHEVSQDPSKAQEQSSDNSPRNSFLEEVIQPLDSGNNSIKDQALEKTSEEDDAEKPKPSDQVIVSQPPKEMNYQEKLMAGPEPSHETNFLYIQLSRSFKKTTKEAFALSKAQELASSSQNHQLQYYLAVNSAIFVQNCFHNFSLVVQGFLSGLAVGHAFFAFVFADPDVLIRGYQWMAVPAQSLFYFCYAISAIDALDRLEMDKSFRISFLNFVTLQKGALVAIIWLAGCACSILMTQTDESLATWDLDVLSNISAKHSSWNDAQDVEAHSSDMLIQWRWLSFSRAVLAMLGWLFLGGHAQLFFSLALAYPIIRACFPVGGNTPNFSEKLPEVSTERVFPASANENTEI